MKLRQLALTFVLAIGGVHSLVPPTVQSSKRFPLTRLQSKQKQASTEDSSSSKKSKKKSKKDESSDSSTEETPMQTLVGGEGLIFEMARRMLVWDKEETASKPTKPPILPRWHPHAGISDVNPAFRTQAPIMNNRGYAGIIWRNVRKRNKPSLWRHALRTYERMKSVEESQSNSALKIQRANIHYEGALLACAKLSLWQEALQIYQDVLENQDETVNQRESLRVTVTDNMILSLISACVHGCKKMDRREASVEERRVPLDAVRDVLLTMEEEHGLPLMALHLNPLAAAYQSLGLMSDASGLLKTHLRDRTTGPESENGDDPFNINDVNAKDKASYALLVKGSVSTGDWTGAVEALRDMTEAGSFPSERNLNSWTEVSERKTRQRNTRSWKKKRDEYWLDSVR